MLDSKLIWNRWSWPLDNRNQWISGIFVLYAANLSSVGFLSSVSSSPSSPSSNTAHVQRLFCVTHAASRVNRIRVFFFRDKRDWMKVLEFDVRPNPIAWDAELCCGNQSNQLVRCPKTNITVVNAQLNVQQLRMYATNAIVFHMICCTRIIIIVYSFLAHFAFRLCEPFLCVCVCLWVGVFEKKKHRMKESHTLGTYDKRKQCV